MVLNSKIIHAIICLLAFACLVSNAQTNVSGGIYTNSTWTMANSPYIIIDTVVVFPGNTLTIEPGVLVKFMNHAQLDIRQASILARGNALDSITFISNSTSPSPGIYSGIYLLSSLYSAFDYCNFYYANHSIYGSPIDSLILNHSNFQFNNVGISNPGNPYINAQNCTFQFNTTAIEGGMGGHYRNCNISNNQNGILNGVWYVIENCIIDSNSNIGIELSWQDSIRYSEIKYNGTGIRLVMSNTWEIVINNNEIEYNTIGIDLASPGNYYNIYCNRICNNFIYDFRNSTSQNSNCLENNYWCTTDSTIISNHVYDGYDDASFGLLDFMPIDTSSCYISGCNLHISTTVTNATCDTCHNGAATAFVTYGFQPITYTWNSSPLQTNQGAIGLLPGNYSVCVTDAHGCTACSPVFIDSTNCTGFAIDATPINTTCSSCNDGIAFVTISGGHAPFNYTWYTNPLQASDTATGLSQGTYAVCVTDLYGCSACDSIIISTGNCSAHFNLYPDSIPHHYTAVNLASGVPPFTYSWSWGDSSSNDTVAFPNHTYATAGFYNICLSIEDAVGCLNTYCTSFYLMRQTNNPMIFLNVIPEFTTNILETSSDENLWIFPNPTYSTFYIKNIQQNSNSYLQIVNTLGEIVHEEKININGQPIECRLLPGLYFIRLYDENETKVLKLIVN